MFLDKRALWAELFEKEYIFLYNFVCYMVMNDSQENVLKLLTKHRENVIQECPKGHAM
jgi:hypothetical protein